MSNVVQLNVPSRSYRHEDRLGDLVAAFADARRAREDVYWLKENAELLNVIETGGMAAGLDQRAMRMVLAPMEEIYEGLGKRLSFFPQYYRFLLAIGLDLEDLGLPGNRMESLVAWAAKTGAASAELSDLQRMEARRLMGRRGIDPLPDDPGLEDRLRGFAARSDGFTLPNKKAAYELTHIVFYLSEYGRKDPGLDDAVVTSLEYVGLLAFLEQNIDLLAEVCVALRFAGAEPSPIWEGLLARETSGFAVAHGREAEAQDDYHEYLVCNWHRVLTGGAPFQQPTGPEPMSFHRAAPEAGPLREMSRCLLELDEGRSDDWHRMRPVVERTLSETGHDILSEAEESSDKFGAFFAGFSRTGAPL
ncbi:DUF6902 family protein [Chachezhania antarctica]|uniref:DUF6902 family protein n=1 Tax=Chachezhania antarctica TaxID=2340860 RepID=UPI000EB25086|nr:hypothetical protein [Chachezhania antarctica]|tara:strand:+ start:103 stop:1188 length:1086 start_codon:yes stop_codon:yes gene_type:complete